MAPRSHGAAFGPASHTARGKFFGRDLLPSPNPFLFYPLAMHRPARYNAKARSAHKKGKPSHKRTTSLPTTDALLTTPSDAPTTEDVNANAEILERKTEEGKEADRRVKLPQQVRGYELWASVYWVFGALVYSFVRHNTRRVHLIINMLGRFGQHLPLTRIPSPLIHSQWLESSNSLRQYTMF